MSASSVVLLRHAPASVAVARWHLAADLRQAGVSPAAIGDATLVLSELLSNAILHARPLRGSRVQVAWELAGGSVQLSVSDGGSITTPRPAYPSLSSVGGRGLSIVEYLTTEWGVCTDDSGTTVWAVLPAPPAGGQASRPADDHGQASQSMDAYRQAFRSVDGYAQAFRSVDGYAQMFRPMDGYLHNRTATASPGR